MLAKKPLKEALKVLRTYDAFQSDYVTATVIQHALGGHAIPVDKPGQRALQRLGISEPEVHALRAVLERAVPKNRGAEFLDLIEDLTNDTCVEGEPACARCELRKICTFALNRKTEPRPNARHGSGHAVKEAVKTAKGSKAAEHPAARAADKKSPTKPAKPAPRADKSRGDKRHGTK
jgi:endonuclease-3